MIKSELEDIHYCLQMLITDSINSYQMKMKCIQVVKRELNMKKDPRFSHHSDVNGIPMDKD